MTLHHAPSPASRAVLRLGTIFFGLGTLAAVAPAQSATAPNFGPNVLIFDPGMTTAQIKAAVDKISTQQVGNQFGTERYAVLFKPGTYGTATSPLGFQVGYYTDVAGLGTTPDAVTINGSINAYNQCDSNGCTALSNFWRSLSNLAINVTTPNAGCYTGNFWAVSQASPMRRVRLNGQATLMDYCTGPSYASGGFIADSVGATIINGSQQQFYMRDSTVTNWTNAVWNQVFSGVTGAPAQSYPNPAYTNLPSTPISREKPYLYVDSAGNYNVFAPGVRTGSVGTTWGAGATAPGRSIPINRFLIATPSTSVREINDALEDGKNLILTPGVYQLQQPIKVKRANTVILGLGLATVVPQKGDTAISVDDVDGVQIAGVIVDAGPVNSPVLLQVGKRHGNAGADETDSGDKDNGKRAANPANPVTLNDVYFRIGGATVGTATTSLEINRDNVLLDDIWAWRADHGAGAKWNVNLGDHGLVVNGNNVTALGLAVEHYQKEQVLWNGNGGTTIFYQSELPYDPPSQTAWMSGTANGYPSYVVSNYVTSHKAFGLGVYSFFNQGIDIVEDNAIITPKTSGIAIHDAGTVFLNGNGSITHVINGVGDTANKSNGGVLHPVVLNP